MGKLSECKNLLNKGADIHTRDNYNLASLHYAASKGKKDII